MVPVPGGFTRVDELSAGDQVFSVHGRPTSVAGVDDLGMLSGLAVTFCDGAVAVVDPDHLWTARDAATGTEAVYRTRDIATNLTMPSGEPRWSIPLAGPIEFTGQPAPAVEPDVFGEELRGGLVDQEIELLSYLTGSVTVRRAVLGGLLGTHGSLPASAPAVVTAALASLARSLGGVVAFEKAGSGWRLRPLFGGRRDVMSVSVAGEIRHRAVIVTEPDGMYVTGGDFVLTRGARCGR